MSDDLNPISNVGDLRKLIAGCIDELPVRVHHGWDLKIAESGFDDEDGAVLLFIDDSRVTTVSRAWLDRVTELASDDPLHPFMPIGEEQEFRDWVDFVERVARPMVEADGDEAKVEEAMRLYRKASPYFICLALWFAARRSDDG